MNTVISDCKYIMYLYLFTFIEYVLLLDNICILCLCNVLKYINYLEIAIFLIKNNLNSILVKFQCLVAT